MAWKIELRKIDGGPDVLAAIAQSLDDRQPLNAVLGKRAEIELRDHFEKRNAEPNKAGWDKLEFWARIRNATSFVSADKNAAHVVIADPAINQKVFGGTIKPRDATYLALPAIAEAYGKSPRVFDFLHVIRFHSGAVALVETDRTLIRFGKKKKDGTRTVFDEGRSLRGRVWYWLARSVTQAPDERALPTEKDFLAALMEEAQEFAERLGKS